MHEVLLALVAAAIGFALGRHLKSSTTDTRTSDDLRGSSDAHERLRDELEQARNNLQAANSDLERFAYIATHDLRAPLRAIDNLTNFLIEDIGQSVAPESAEHLNMLKSRVARLDQMLVSLLEYSRVARHFEPSVSMNVRRAIDDAVALHLQPETKVSINGDNVDFPLPPSLFSAMLGHVFTNAEKHGQRDDVDVIIHCSLKGDTLEIRVTDNGPGIAPDLHSKAFELFSTLQPRDSVEGSGMGLAIVAKAMRNIGGGVAIDSDPSPGAGATIVLTWPAHRADHERGESSPG